MTEKEEKILSIIRQARTDAAQTGDEETERTNILLDALGAITRIVYGREE